MRHATILATIIAASLTACGGGGTQSDSPVVQPPSVPAPAAPAASAPVAPAPAASAPALTWVREFTITPIAVQPERMHAVTQQIPECAGSLTAYADMVIRTSAQGQKSQRETYMAVMMSLDGVPQEKQRSVATLRIADGLLASESTYEFRRTLGATPAMYIGLDVYKFTYFDYTAVEIVEATLQLTCGTPAA
jgi:hypothetical protein